MLSKDTWSLIATYSEWPEVWALTRVCRASYNGCKSTMKIHRCELRLRVADVTHLNYYTAPLNAARRLISAHEQTFNPTLSWGKQLRKRTEAINELKLIGDDFYRFSIISR